MKRGIFRKTFLIYVMVLLLSIAFIEYYVSNVIREDRIDSIKNTLIIEASLISKMVDFSSAGSLDAFCNDLKTKTGARVTIIATDGRVVGDSDAVSATMENHSGRPEIQQASIDGVGHSIRRSSTLKEDLLYTAIEIRKSGELQGYVRLALSLSDVNSSTNQTRMEILLAVIVLFVLFGGISIIQTERIKKLVDDVTGFTAALAGGKLDRMLMLEGTGEFEGIASNLNRLALELQETVERSREEYQRLDVILKGIPDALLILDADSRIVMFSSASTDYFNTEKLKGILIGELLRIPRLYELISTAKKSRSTVEEEIELEDNEKRNVILKLSPLKYKAGEPSGMLAIFHDITRLRKLEQIRKDFVANVSHELKTPIASIQGFADTLIEGAMDDKESALRFLGIIKSNSERINSLVDDLMTISQIELGAIKLQKTHVDLGEIFDHVSSNFSERVAEKGLYLNVSLDPHFTDVVADRNRLDQVLMNLIDNAVKYTEKGGINVGTELVDGARCIFVSDTGIGVPNIHLSRLGERFYRVDTSRSRAQGGTGLGLAIVKHLIRVHGWRMSIESTEAKGTKVRIIVDSSQQKSGKV